MVEKENDGRNTTVILRSIGYKRQGSGLELMKQNWTENKTEATTELTEQK